MIQTTREQRRQMAREAAKLPTYLIQVPWEDWPAHPPTLTCVWRSRDFLVQVFKEAGNITRLSVCRTKVDVKQGRWEEGISWDELQRLKREAGFGQFDAVEVYPADEDVVNVANMRHLWVFADPLPFKWERKAGRPK